MAPTGSSSANYWGIVSLSELVSGNTQNITGGTAELKGGYFGAFHSGTGTIDRSSGATGQAIVFGTGNLLNVYSSQ